jgi:hypothetical protein
MNKVLLLPIVFITLINLGLGIEGNMNTREAVALGTAISADYGIIPNLAAGIKFGFNHKAHIMILEPEFFARWYFGDLKGLSFFTQAGIGISIIFEDVVVKPAVLGDLAAGLRIPFNQWYVEPHLLMWGAGISAGYRL